MKSKLIWFQQLRFLANNPLDDKQWHQHCSLLVNTVEQTVIQIKTDFDDININNLFEKLIDNVTIIKFISFMLCNKEETKVRSKHFLNQI